MRRFSITVCAAVASAAAIVVLAPARPALAQQTFSTTVIAVPAGDSVTIRRNLVETPIRLYGVSAPGPGQRLAAEAQQLLDRLTRTEVVRIEVRGGGDNNAPGAPLVADVFRPNGTSVAEELVRAGLATPNPQPEPAQEAGAAGNARLTRLQELEQEAKTARRGLWGPPERRPNAFAGRRTYVPSQTRVAVLPVLDVTEPGRGPGNSDLALRTRDQLEFEFAHRGFRLLPFEQAAGAARRLGIDLSDPAQQTVANLQRIGQNLGADLLAFSTITHVRRHRVTRTSGYEGEEGRAVVKTWLLDVPAERTILDGVPAEGRSDGRANRIGFPYGDATNFVPVGDGRRYFGPAAANAVVEALSDFLTAYPGPSTNPLLQERR